MGPTSKKIIRALMGILSMTMFVFFALSVFGGTPDPFSPVLAMAFVFNDLDHEGGDNIGGFTSVAWLGIAHEIKTYPTQDRNAVELEGNYEMKPGKKFYKIYVTAKTGGAEAENQGELDGMSFLQKPVFFHPGTRKEVLAMARKLNNARGVILFKDPNSGNIVQFGDQDFPVYFKPRVAFGMQPTDRRGLFVDCEADNFNAALIYPGTIPLDPAPDPLS
jgi:hypothetical protein